MNDPLQNPRHVWGKHNDPLQNPRPVWGKHYDHRTLAGRWGVFLAKIFGIRHYTWRHYDELQRKYGA